MDHLGLISHKLLVPGFSRSNQDKNSHIDITVSSQTDMMSALGLRSEMKKTSERMQSIILLSPTLNRRDDNFKGSQISVIYLIVIFRIMHEHNWLPQFWKSFKTN